MEFNLRRDLPMSAYPGSFGESRSIEHGRSYVRWRLHLKGEGAAVSLERSIEVPILEAGATDRLFRATAAP